MIYMYIPNFILAYCCGVRQNDSPSPSPSPSPSTSPSPSPSPREDIVIIDLPSN